MLLELEQSQQELAQNRHDWKLDENELWQAPAMTRVRYLVLALIVAACCEQGVERPPEPVTVGQLVQWLPLHLVFDLDACMFEVLHGTSSENFLQTDGTDRQCVRPARHRHRGRSVPSGGLIRRPLSATAAPCSPPAKSKGQGTPSRRAAATASTNPPASP